MKITFLGHASFRIEIADQTLLIDPWLTGNPVLPEDQHQAAVAGATHILLTHAHFDHMADVVRLSKELNVPLVGQYDLMGWFEESEGISVVGFNKGGTVTLGDVAVTMVNAVHSSTTRTENGLQAKVFGDSGGLPCWINVLLTRNDGLGCSATCWFCVAGYNVNLDLL